MKTYKGFDKDLKCRNMQYEVGKEYTMDGKIKACERGFHACENPLEVMNYYNPTTSRYCEVEQSGEISRDGEDSKVASSTIRVSAEIGIPGLVKAQVEWTKDSAKKTTKSDTANAATSGYRANAATSGVGANAATSGVGANAATSGYRANAATSGERANAATSGVGANAATSGDWANAATSGDWANAATSGVGACAVCSGSFSAADATGNGCVAVAWGMNNKSRGSIGSYLVLCERGDWSGTEYPILNAKMVFVDGKKIKADTWYKMVDGAIVEVEQ